MSVTSIIDQVVYDTDGTTGPFPITFPVRLNSSYNARDICVEYVDADGVKTDVTLASTVSGLNVTLGTAYETGGKIVIYRKPDAKQESVYSHGTVFPAKQFEGDLDFLTFLVQRALGETARSLKVPAVETGDSELLLPTAVNRASKYLAFDAAGDPIVSGGGIDPAIPVSAYIETLLDDADAAAARDTLDVFSRDEIIGRNKLINGNFDVWQRGTSVAVATGETKYQADRWSVQMAGTSAATTYSRQTFSPGQTSVPNNPRYFLRSLCTNGGDATNGLHLLSQKIEDVSTFAGKATVLTFWAKADAAKNVAIEIVQMFGSGGSPSSSVTTYIATVALTTSWQKFEIPVTVPSISGKTIGTSGYNTSYLSVNFWMSAGSTYAARTNTLGIQTGTFDFAQVQIEEGSEASKYEDRSYSVELLLCQRYYIPNLLCAASTSFALETTVGFICPYIRMRVSPTITFAGAVFSKSGTGNYAVSAITVNPGASGASIGGCTIAAGAGTGIVGTVAGLVLDAEF